MRLFEYKLAQIVDVVCENIDKKWPYIEKQLLRAFMDIDFPVAVRQELLTGYEQAVDNELQADPEKRRVLNYFDRFEPRGSTRRDPINVAKENGTPRSQRPPTRREYVLEYFKKYLVQADPFAAASGGRKTPYVNHIVRWLLNGSAVFPEDIEQINELLATYNKLKNNFGQELPDLETINDPNKLRSMLMQYRESESYQTLHDKKLPNIVPGIDVYRIDTWEEGKDILCDSGWCVRNKFYFDEYKPPFYVFVTKTAGKSKRLALFNINSGELKDVYNDELSKDVVTTIAPIIDEIITNYSNVGYPNYELIDTLAPIIHLMPKTVHKLEPEALAEMASIAKRASSKIPERWPAYIEKQLREDPLAYISYVETITGEISIDGGDYGPRRDPELEEELIDLAYVYFDRNFEYIARLVEYFGARYDEFDGEWPPLKALLQEIPKYSLESEFYRHMRHANKDGIYAFLQLVGSEWSGSDRLSEE